MCLQRAHQTSQLLSATGTAPSPLKVERTCVWMPLFFTSWSPRWNPLNTEHMRIPIKPTPQEIIAEYNLLSLVSDGHVYIEVHKGMYPPPKLTLSRTNYLSAASQPMAIYQPNSRQASAICSTRLESSGIWPMHPICTSPICIPTNNPQRHYQYLHPRNCRHAPSSTTPAPWIRPSLSP
jgi:hypothetical protein